MPTPLLELSPCFCPCVRSARACASQCHLAGMLSHSGLTGICTQGLWKPELCLENGVQPVQGTKTGGVPPAPLPSSRYVWGGSQPPLPNGTPQAWPLAPWGMAGPAPGAARPSSLHEPQRGDWDHHFCCASWIWGDCQQQPRLPRAVLQPY